MRKDHDKSPPQFRLRHNFHLLVKNVLATSIFLTPCLACAVGIGEAVLQSRLGEPLLVKVELTAERAEHIVTPCLSLAKPGADEDQSSYLTRAQLSLLTEAGRSYVEIRTREPFNEPFAMMRLQVKCPGSGMGAIVKTLAILPDLPSTYEPPLASAINAPAETVETVQPAPAETSAANTAAPQPDLPALPASAQPQSIAAIAAPAQPAPGEAIPAAKLPPATAPAPQPKAAPARRDGLETALSKPRPGPKRQAQNQRYKAVYKPDFKLKLSGSLLDESLIGKSSGRRKAQLLEQKKDQDADNQTAQYLTLLHQVKLLQEELESVKLKLAHIQTTPELAASTPVVAAALAELPVTASATEPAQEIQPLPVAAVPVAASSPAASSFIGMRDIAYFAAELFLAALAILLGMRFINRKKPTLDDEDLFQTITAKPVPAPVPAKPAVVPAPASVAPPAAMRAAPAPKPVTTSAGTYIQEPKPEISEADLLLEEAELYNIHGHPDKAVVILEEIIQKFPDKTEARLLLLTIYSSSGKKQEFERAAQNLMKRNPDEPTMQAIQALERAFDRKKPFNAGETTSKIPAAKPATPLDLEFELPSGQEHAPDISFEMPDPTIKVADINFDIPAAGPGTGNFKETPSANPSHEITVDLDALLKNLK